MYTTADGMPVANSGLTASRSRSRAWSPDGTASLRRRRRPDRLVRGWNVPPPGDLKVYAVRRDAEPDGSARADARATGGDRRPAHRLADASRPTASGSSTRARRRRHAHTATATSTSPAPSTPNQEVRLAKLDGDGYPFAAGARDLSWNFEPSFAPVAAGGYFWVVFTSRRTYGNIAHRRAETRSVKQLWVAAIDQNPKPGVDPSHPAFHLTGQDESNLAMRGFWSLPPCAQDGQGCASGTDCCGGYCAARRRRRRPGVRLDADGLLAGRRQVQRRRATAATRRRASRASTTCAPSRRRSDVASGRRSR